MADITQRLRERRQAWQWELFQLSEHAHALVVLSCGDERRMATVRAWTDAREEQANVGYDIERLELECQREPDPASPRRQAMEALIAKLRLRHAELRQAMPALQAAAEGAVRDSPLRAGAPNLEILPVPGR